MDWQTLPLYFDRTLGTFFGIPIYGYGVMVLMGLLALVAYSRLALPQSSARRVSELLPLLVLGTLVGARLGYALWYDPALFTNPWQFVSPFTTTGEYVGLRGLSFHGGVVGFVATVWLYARWYQQNFWSLVDTLAVVTPAFLFFGRLGNYWNGELYGRVTTMPWGQYFALGDVLRHPSALYEAAGEGLILGIIMYFAIRRHQSLPGCTGAVFLMGYGVIRFALEYFRQPDPQLGLLALQLSMGQWLSMGLVIVGVVVYTRAIISFRSTL